VGLGEVTLGSEASSASLNALNHFNLHLLQRERERGGQRLGFRRRKLRKGKKMLRLNI
jgi:hypothetical protein